MTTSILYSKELLEIEVQSNNIKWSGQKVYEILGALLVLGESFKAIKNQTEATCCIKQFLMDNSLTEATH